MAATFAVVGEALIDLVDPGDDSPCLAHPGGSPLNVAIGLARLEQPTAFVGRFSRDPFGTVLRNHALRSDVDLSLAVADERPTTIALVTLVDGVAQYDFSVEGTADFGWSDDLPTLPPSVRILHFGSLASWLPPGSTAIAGLVTSLHAAGNVLISYDPNVRPQLQPDSAAARDEVERALRHAHVVKASDEDLRWLYAGSSVEEVAHRWLGFGPSLVVITRGNAGAVAFTPTHTISRPIRPAHLVDTVGAGDAFMSGLLDGLARRGVTSPGRLGHAVRDASTVAAAVDEAALVAAATCARAGASPPRRSELGRVSGP
jgi:fructokinase